MEQRPLRLGDIVDDYCPRERRVTNHAIVAIVENTIRQTRCATCDTEHVYKGGAAPRRRPKDSSSADDKALDLVPGQLIGSRPADASERPLDEPALAEPRDDERDEAAPTEDGDLGGTPDPAGAAEEVGLHRRLIRATLPRIDGEPSAPRPIPEFTMHQRSPQRGGGWGHNGFNRNNGQGRGQGGFNAGHGRQGPPAGRPGRHRNNKSKRAR